MEIFTDSTNIKWKADKLVKFMLNYTKVYQEYEDAPTAIRELKCLEVQYPNTLLPIQDMDVVAGRTILPAILFSPQGDGNDGGFGYIASPTKIRDILYDKDLSANNKTILLELSEYWKNRNSTFKTRKAYPDKLETGLPSDNWTAESGIAFPLYRIGGTHLNFKKLVKLGLPGLIAEANSKKERCLGNKDKTEFYDSIIGACDVISKCCLFYANEAKELSKTTSEKERVSELNKMTEVLQNISTKKPETFREALQLFFLFAIISGTQNYGRIDDYLGDFYVNDLEKGILNKEQALRLMESLWHLMIARNASYDGRVVIGGKGRENEKTADPVALLAMETSDRVKDILPQLTLRFYKGQNPALYQKGLDVIGSGGTFPMLYNDDVNIPAVAKAMDVSLDEAQHYLPYGCGEFILYHRSVATPSSVLNMLKALEVVLHKGTDTLSGKQIGIPASEISFDSFEKLLEAYKKQIEYYVDLLAIQEDIEYKVAGEEAPFLLFSMLYDDCTDMGEGIFQGGLRYLNGTEEIYGFTNTADSLLAIKIVVFEQKLFSLEELVKMLDADFKGFEKERKQLEAIAKYGNDNAEADAMAKDIHDHICNFTRDQREKTNLNSFLVVNINNDANTTLGKFTLASADGRNAFRSMSNGNSPMMGKDTNGATALLNSLVKIDPSNHAGAVQNIKFSKDMFSKYRKQLESLLQTYWNNGGTQLMITAVGKNELQEALKKPERYQNLIVRVGGFSARFVQLSKDVQREILNRTLY